MKAQTELRTHAQNSPILAIYKFSSWQEKASYFAGNRAGRLLCCEIVLFFFVCVCLILDAYLSP